MKIQLSTFTKIKRTIQQLSFSYPEQRIHKESVLKCLSDEDFQTKYINY